MLTSVSATKMVREAAEVLIEKPIEAIVGCERTNDGFLFKLEICETKAHIADNDILATYEFALDKKTAEVLSYARLTRSRRSDTATQAA